MTTEQAIKLLHRLQDEQFDGIHGDERREALEMAVRALEPNLGNNGSIFTKTGVNDEDRTTDDTISRKMTIETITRISGIRGDVLKALYDLPTAQPQRKTGQLLYHHTEDIDEERTADVYFCSSCKEEVLKKIRFGFCGGELDIQYGFCPICGARMGESDE